MTDYHIAQLNIANAQDTMDSDTMKGFVDRLDEINALADNSRGFVWRLQTEEGDATSINAFDDPMLIVNMSVWETLESLKDYVYKSIHLELLRDKAKWFHKMPMAHHVLWSVPAGHIPTVEEGKQRLQYLRQHGPSEYAYTFANAFVHE